MHSLSSNTPQHKTSSVSSDTDAHRAPGHFLRKDGPADILGKRHSRVGGKGFDAETRVHDPDSVLADYKILEF